MISTSSRDLPNKASVAMLSIKVVEGDLNRVSSYCALHEVRLRFLLFSLSMPIYMSLWPTTLLDTSRNDIRDGVEIRGGGEDGGELGGEERGDDNEE